MLLVGKGYFIDLEARLFRETMDPGRYVDFDSVKGKWSCQQAGVVTCLSCGASVIVSGFHGQDPTTRPCDASRTSGFGINLAQLSRSQPRIAFSGRTASLTANNPTMATQRPPVKPLRSLPPVLLMLMGRNSPIVDRANHEFFAFASVVRQDTRLVSSNASLSPTPAQSPPPHTGQGRAQ